MWVIPVMLEVSCMVECGCLQDERRRLHRSSEGASNDGSNEGNKEADNDSGQSQVLQGSDASDDEVVDVVTEDEDAEDAEEDGTKDEVWMSEKRHSGDGEVTAVFLSR